MEISNVIPAEFLDTLLLAIAALMTFLVTAGIKSLGKLFKKDFSKTAKAISAIVSAGFVGIATNVLQFMVSSMPPETASIVQQTLSLAVVLLSAMGVQYERKKLKTSNIL